MPDTVLTQRKESCDSNKSEKECHLWLSLPLRASGPSQKAKARPGMAQLL